LKREKHRQALLEAIARPNKKLFLGTDSAPHPKNAKENACGCAGIYSSFAALGLYAEAFEEAGALNNFNAFCSENGADFYGLPRNGGEVKLVREDWTVPSVFDVGGGISLVPIRAGNLVKWKLG
jgi:dihydroorotase